MPLIETVKEVSTVYIDMPKIEGFEDLSINNGISLEISGKVKSLSENEENQSIRIEVSEAKVTSKEENNDGLGRLRKSFERAEGMLNVPPSQNRPIPSP